MGGSDSSEYEYTAANFREPTVLVIGGEAKGLRRLTSDTCDQLVRIPMYGTIPSLNVAVATGIILFEVKATTIDVLKGNNLIQFVDPTHNQWYNVHNNIYNVEY